VGARGAARPGACTGCGAACMAPPGHELPAGTVSTRQPRGARSTGRGPLTGGLRRPVAVTATASRPGGARYVEVRATGNSRRARARWGRGR
jgi:hypothetical protein